MLYTIGSSETYDRNLKKNTLSKSKGGTVWNDLNSVLEYHSNCIVTIDNIAVHSSIYVVDGNWNSDVIIESRNRGSLNKPCKIIKKYESNKNI